MWGNLRMPASRTVTARRLAWPVSSLTARPLAPKGAACLDAHEQTLACRVPSSHTSPHAVPVITMAAGQLAGERLPGLGGDNFLQTLYVSPPKGPIPSDWTFRGVGEPGGKVGPSGGGSWCVASTPWSSRSRTLGTHGNGRAGVAQKAQGRALLAPAVQRRPQSRPCRSRPASSGLCERPAPAVPEPRGARQDAPL